MTTRREFFTQKIRRRYYQTIEFYHPTVGTRRYVRRSQDPLSFTLESDAPRNASQSVEFTGAAFEYVLPEQNGSTITAEVQLGRVGTEVKSILKQIKGANRS